MWIPVGYYDETPTCHKGGLNVADVGSISYNRYQHATRAYTVGISQSSWCLVTILLCMRTRLKLPTKAEDHTYKHHYNYNRLEYTQLKITSID